MKKFVKIVKMFHLPEDRSFLLSPGDLFLCRRLELLLPHLSIRKKELKDEKKIITA